MSEVTPKLSDRSRRATLMVFDGLLLAVSLWVAVVLRYGDLYKDVGAFWWLFPIVGGVGVGALYRFGFYRAIVRYIGPSSMLPVAQGITVAALAVALAAYLSQAWSFPRSSPLIFWFVAILMVGGSRLAIRTYFYGAFNNYLVREPIAIYGAGSAGAQLAMALLNDNQYMPVAFFDDNPNLHKNTIHGIRVYGADSVGPLAEQLGIQQILLALPSATVAERKRVLERLSALPVHIRTVPSVADLISGRASITEVKEIEISDLLGREVVPANDDLLDASIRGKSVLVTGAGGTIGSELCRTILRQHPMRLVLFDNSEFSLFRLEQELADSLPSGTELVVLLGSVLNRGHLDRVIDDLAVQTLYHAAAYKHVHLVERNIIEGVRNNVVGTWNVANVASERQVEVCVLVSSDKAVRPANVMGATKRLAELIFQGFDQAESATAFSIVRFGNVLRSSGSVVPTFEQQIRSGGPVRVTHRDATRYFMTASEAAELVIQAGSLASGGEVFVLDMGDPVNIRELAERMIHLHGREVRGASQAPDETTVAIEFIGLRPGEKLHEELVIGNSVSGTRHPKIMRAEELRISPDRVSDLCTAIATACEAGDHVAVRRLLQESDIGYAMAEDVVDPVLMIEMQRRAPANVTPFRQESND